MKKQILVLLSIGVISITKAQTETFTLSNLNQLQSKYNSVLTKLIQDSISIENEIQILRDKRKELEIKQEKYEQLYGVPSSLIADEIKKIGGKRWEYVDRYYGTLCYYDGYLGKKILYKEDLNGKISESRSNLKQVENLIQISK